jgi:hypothetical protein
MILAPRYPRLAACPAYDRALAKALQAATIQIR